MLVWSRGTRSSLGMQQKINYITSGSSTKRKLTFFSSRGHNYIFLHPLEPMRNALMLDSCTSDFVFLFINHFDYHVVSMYIVYRTHFLSLDCNFVKYLKYMLCIFIHKYIYYKMILNK